MATKPKTKKDKEKKEPTLHINIDKSCNDQWSQTINISKRFFIAQEAFFC